MVCATDHFVEKGKCWHFFRKHLSKKSMKKTYCSKILPIPQLLALFSQPLGLRFYSLGLADYSLGLQELQRQMIR